MPNTDAINTIYGKLEKRNTMTVAMIDYGKCDIENIRPCSETCIDGIRVIFKEKIMHEALEYCREIKNLGYKVFVQLVSVTTYTEKKLLELIDIVNEIKPYAVSMVDTYGLLHMGHLMKIADILDANLSKDIMMGYHAHNNFQMGYANGITFIDREFDRDILVDGTLYGMGKSAGNTPLELLAMHLNNQHNRNYDISQILEAIECNIIELYNIYGWGYSLFYYVASFTECHPNYVSYLMNKKTLSMKSIIEILSALKKEKKLLYDERYIEEKYIEYQNVECDDTNVYKKLQALFIDKDILIFGPGQNADLQKDRIESFLENKDIIKISINHIPKTFRIDYLFLTNSKKYSDICYELNNKKNDIKIIATTNVVRTYGDFDYVLNYSNLIDKEELIPDNSLLMLLRILMKSKAGQILLAGFDGYPEDEMNYYSTNMERQIKRGSYINKLVNRFLEQNKTKIYVRFITDTYYQGEMYK